MEPLSHDRPDDRLRYEIGELSEECVLDLSEVGKGFRRLFRKPEKFPAHPALSRVECIFEGRSEIDVHGGSPLSSLSKMGNDATAVVPIAGVLRLVPGLKEHLVPAQIVVDGREEGEGDNRIRYNSI